jgi:predicted NAD/FAD-dependent oxidoreductase
VAGVAGLSAAHELAERDFEVTVMRPDRLRAVDGELLDTADFDPSSTKPSNTAAAVESTI